MTTTSNRSVGHRSASVVVSRVVAVVIGLTSSSIGGDDRVGRRRRPRYVCDARPSIGRPDHLRGAGGRGYSYVVGVTEVSARASDELVLVGERGRSGARREIELREDVAHVPGDGLLADDEFGSRSRGWSCRRDEPEHLDLTPVRPPGDGTGRPCERVEPRSRSAVALRARGTTSAAASNSIRAVSSSPRPRQDRPMSVLTRAASYGASRSCHDDPRAAEGAERALGVAACQEDGAVGLGGERRQQGRTVPRSRSRPARRRRSAPHRRRRPRASPRRTRPAAAVVPCGRGSRRALAGGKRRPPSVRPCASRRRDRPGSGRRPARLAAR